MKSTNIKELKEAFDTWRLFCEAGGPTKVDIPHVGDTLQDIPNLYEFMNDVSGGGVDTLVDAIPVVDGPRVPQADVFFNTPNGIWRLRFDQAGETIIDMVDDAAVLPAGLMDPSEAAEHLRNLPDFDEARHGGVLRSLDNLAVETRGLLAAASIEELEDIAGRPQGRNFQNLGSRIMYRFKEAGSRISDAFNAVVDFWSPEAKDARDLQKLAKWKRKMFDAAFKGGGSAVWGRVDPKGLDKWQAKRAKAKTGLDPGMGRTGDLSSLETRIGQDDVEDWAAKNKLEAEKAGNKAAALDEKADTLDSKGRKKTIGGSSAEDLRKEAALLREKANFLEDLVKDVRKLNAAAPRGRTAWEFTKHILKSGAHWGRYIFSKFPGWLKWVGAGISAYAVYEIADDIYKYLGSLGEAACLGIALLVEEDPTGIFGENLMTYLEEAARRAWKTAQYGGELDSFDRVLLASMEAHMRRGEEADEDRRKNLELKFGRLSGTGEHPNVPAGPGKMEESFAPRSLKIILG